MGQIARFEAPAMLASQRREETRTELSTIAADVTL